MTMSNRITERRLVGAEKCVPSTKRKPKRSAAEQAAPPREIFQLLIDCGAEQAQRQLYERLQAEGWPCRVLVL